MVSQHLVFYDGECGLCDKAVQFVLARDKAQDFDFAPLQGTTAAEMLKELPENIKTADSLILIENYKTPNRSLYIYGKGAFRICWLLGGAWSILGLLSFLPSILYDWGYRLVARNRHKLFATKCMVPSQQNKHRFLP